jgi:hypothetical protein
MPKETAKAMIFDVDGTAIPNGRWAHPTKAVVEAFNKAHQQGFVLAAATGRNYKFCRYILEELDVTSPSIVAAGTQIIDPKNGKEIWSAAMDKETVKFALEKIMPFKSKILVDEDTPEEALAVDKIKIGKYRLLDVQDIPFGDVDELIEELRKYQGLSVVKVNSVNAGFSNLHVTHKEATKEHAIEKWLELHKLLKDDVIGVGDGHNDIELFKSVGYRVAMGNAVPELKEVADEVIGGVDEDGLATFILELLS